MIVVDWLPHGPCHKNIFGATPEKLFGLNLQVRFGYTARSIFRKLTYKGK